MLKIAWKIMALVVILACAGPFFIRGPDGRPLITLQDLTFEMPSIPLLNGEAGAPGLTKVYRWQDDEGVWHFSNNPEDAEGHEIIEFDGDINVLAAPQTGAKPPSDKPALSMPGFTTLAPEQVSEMIRAATELQETVEQRKADIDEAID